MKSYRREDKRNVLLMFTAFMQISHEKENYTKDEKHFHGFIVTKKTFLAEKGCEQTEENSRHCKVFVFSQRADINKINV